MKPETLNQIIDLLEEDETVDPNLKSDIVVSIVNRMVATDPKKAIEVVLGMREC